MRRHGFSARRKSRHAALLLSGGVLAAQLAACGSPDTHVVLGQRYDMAGDCLEPTSSIDIVEGADPGLDCSPTCVLTPSGSIYASTECGAFPVLDDTTGADPACVGALAALRSMAVCGGGAGGDDAGDAATEGPSTDGPVETVRDATPELDAPSPSLDT